MKTFVIGDIHGAFKALKQVLKRSGFEKKEDRLIFLGDYIDGWNETVELLRFLASLKKSSERHIFLEGNHDGWLRNWLKKGESDDLWEMNGGLEVMREMEAKGSRTDKDILNFLCELQSYYVENGKLFVHAGFLSPKGVQHDNDKAHFWDRDFWYGIYENDEKIIQKSLKLYDEVYIGHTPIINFRDDKRKEIETPIFKANVCNMDTGAGWGAPLSCMNIDTKELFQSDRTEKLYPNEAGR